MTPPSATAQFAAMTAEQAAQFMSRFGVQPSRAFVAQLIGPTGTVVDLGCGRGDEVSDLFTPEQYTGVDCAAELIKIARQKHPRHQFCVAEAAKVRGWWDYGIIKSVLENLSEDEAVALYRNALAICGTLFVVWHMEPTLGRPTYDTYAGEVGTMQQNRHRWQAFVPPVPVFREQCERHMVWKVAGTPRYQAEASP